MYEQPRPRRFGPALIAFLVVLAAAAGTVGYFGARRVLGLGQAQPPATTGPGAGVTTTPTGAGTAPTPTATKPAATTTTVRASDGSRCPAVTAQAVQAKGLDDELTLLVYVEAQKAGTTNAEAWVCQNADGVLIYQGHVLNGPLNSADNGINTLLLAEGIKGKVEPGSADATWVATNPSGLTATEYHVSFTRLLVVKQPGDTVLDEYVVIRSNP